MPGSGWSNGAGAAIRRFLFALCLAAALLPGTVAADAPEAPAQAVVRWNASLDAAERKLEGGIDDSALLDSLWVEIDQARQEAVVTVEEVTAKSKEIRRLLGALGPKPGAGELPEPADVEAQRRRLEQTLATAESLLKQANLVVERSDGVRVALTTAKRQVFSRNLSAKLPVPLIPDTWREALDEFGEVDNELEQTGQRFSSSALALGALLAVVFGVAVAGRISRVAAHGLLQRFGQTVSDVAPGYRHRVRAAGIVALSLGLLPAALSISWLALVWATLERYLLLGEQSIKPVGISLGLAFYFLFSALVGAVFRPRTPAWRLIPLTREAAGILARRLHILVLLLAVDLPFVHVIEAAGRPPAMASVHTFLLSLVLTGMGLWLLPERLWQWQPLHYGDADVSTQVTADAQLRMALTWRLSRWLTTFVFGTACAATLAGYGNLGAYLLRAMLWTLLLVVMLLALRGVTREALTLLLTGHERRPRTALGVLNYWLLVCSDLLLAMIGFVGILISWGVPRVGLVSAVKAAVDGFTIGEYRIVPSHIILGIVVFSALVLVTRFLQRQLEERVLPGAHLDIGVRTAIGAVTGYLGIALAFVSAVSIMGIDLGQLALIAGALSVGIGFGLQNIVNNFISGAILLAEQPIKIGDWIVVGNIEGNVRRISIRATEIETFNRASVIVPNSDLLQTAVTNWTYKNRRGRVDIPIGVAYQSNPEEVEAILLDCARRHEKVSKWPEPLVLLQRFGDNSLDFELRVYVSDIEQRALIASDLRKTLLSRFRDSGIEIPFPQRDVWVRRTDSAAAAFEPELPAVAPEDRGAAVIRSDG